ncbi:putative oxidoreductase AIM17 [Rhodotorula toruloides]|uniref:TauD/TfdA-like domain-containing protein n=2 Tax=Rhodotorula toruloides TaxID=5286 RepID=A0A0K3CGJ8_RHOTO|nr:putative oxidoreductase AIM17 [Rhodotorula toruloides]
MLRTLARTHTPRSLARCSSTSAPRTAPVLARQPPHAADPPSSPSPSHTPDQAQLKPQPFILRPLSRRYQLETVSTTTHAPSTCTTLHFVSPHAPSQPRTVSLPNLFLRDASIHPDHVHPSSQQKLFRTTDVPLEGKLVGYGVHDVPGHGECLVTEWSTPVRGVSAKSAKLSVVPIDFLAGIMTGDAEHAERDGEVPAARPWDKQQLEKTIQWTDYEAFKKDDQAFLQTLDSLIRDGIVFLRNVPTDAKEGHHTELRNLVERIGSLRRTWYGDLWDVKAIEGSLNIAYTNLDLGLHMDLTHFDNPPRYQFLHSLQNTHIRGGLSYFVDTYALASHLHTHSPSSFQTLCTEPVRFEYKNGPHHTKFVRPTFELRQGSSQALHAVNYSPPFQGALPLERLANTKDGSGRESDDAERLADLHSALSEFATLCDDAGGKWRFEHQLEPGECVVFDNRRVLHARTAFEFLEGKEGEGGRWLKGAYMDGDEVLSRWRVLKAKQREDVAKKGRTLFT